MIPTLFEKMRSKRTIMAKAIEFDKAQKFRQSFVGALARKNSAPNQLIKILAVTSDEQVTYIDLNESRTRKATLTDIRNYYFRVKDEYEQFL